MHDYVCVDTWVDGHFSMWLEPFRTEHIFLCCWCCSSIRTTLDWKRFANHKQNTKNKIKKNDFFLIQTDNHWLFSHRLILWFLREVKNPHGLPQFLTRIYWGVWLVSCSHHSLREIELKEYQPDMSRINVYIYIFLTLIRDISIFLCIWYIYIIFLVLNFVL